MTRQVRRFESFELTLDTKRDDFIAAPTESQRKWLLSRPVKELCDELHHAHAIAPDLSGCREDVRFADRTQAALTPQEVMEDWQVPVVTRMADIAAASSGRVLEVGFGRGVSAQRIQEHGVEQHVIVECNDTIVERYEEWRRQHPKADIRLLHGRWQDSVDELETYDGILFHAYPLNEEELYDHVVKAVTFAAHFFSVAAEHLRPGGSFTYLTNERDSLSRAHQRLLLEHFTSFSLSVVAPLSIPRGTRDSFWADRMVVVDARK